MDDFVRKRELYLGKWASAARLLRFKLPMRNLSWHESVGDRRAD